ncbi:MAG TPA: ABC transporter substrate-binding protein [Candidatus Micrarchaeia archaeon]|nr:ABC transporter substrate-binding protein [Candidatus Micrarchaeia archaeon]
MLDHGNPSAAAGGTRATPSRRRRGRRSATAAGLAALILGLAACGQSGPGPASRSARVQPKGVVRVAVLPESYADYIFPIYTSAADYFQNFYWLEALLWRPLYWFGVHGTPGLNQSLSLAGAPVFSDGGRTATITLKPYRWSDGRPVTSRDVLFDFNLLRANRANVPSYHQGGFPANVTRFHVLSPTRFQVTFNRAYDRTWLLWNELDYLTPLPQHAWDRTGVSGSVGNADETTSGAVAVYKFLSKQSSDVGSYAQSPLWKVVDGPWRLHSYIAATGFLSLVPNPRYSGPVKPTIAKIEEVPFTSSTAEFDALRAGAVDYGYLPFADVNQASYFQHHGYRIVPWWWYAVSFIELDFTNPKTKAIMGQPYLRQALQHLVDEPAYIKDILHGYGVQTYGPVPNDINSQLAIAAEKQDPYPYSISQAEQLLRGHGWVVRPGGVDTCQRPGAGPRSCGQGVARGAALALTFLYQAGTANTVDEAEAIRSSALRAGIQLTLRSESATAILTLNGICPQAPPCNWDLTYWYPGGWDYGTTENYPTGGAIWGAGQYYSGGYAAPQMERAIAATHTGGLAALHRYEAYARTALPVLWTPVTPLQLSVVSNRLRGVTPQDPYGQIYPEAWRLSG